MKFTLVKLEAVPIGEDAENQPAFSGAASG